MEQIRTLSNQLDTMNVANSRRHQPTPRFMDEDDMVTLSEADLNNGRYALTCRDSKPMVGHLDCYS